MPEESDLAEQRRMTLTTVREIVAERGTAERRRALKEYVGLDTYENAERLIDYQSELLAGLAEIVDQLASDDQQNAATNASARDSGSACGLVLPGRSSTPGILLCVVPAQTGTHGC